MDLFRYLLHHKNQSINLNNIEENRNKFGNLLIFACFFLYTASMAVKGVFAAETKFIVDLWNLEYAKASMTNTFYFVPYGLVQTLMFIFIKKINMRKFMIATIPVAAISTTLMGVSQNIGHMWLFFGLTGAFQASIYCGCNAVLTRYLPAKLMSKANKIMNCGYAVGSFVSYGLSAFCITYGQWRIPYFVLGGIFMIAVIVFAIIITKAARFRKINNRLDQKAKNFATAEERAVSNTEDDPILGVYTKKRTIIFYTVDLIMVFLITSLYYCIMNYITSLLVDVHGVNQDISIYVSMIAPLAIVFGPMLTISSCDHHRDFIRQAINYSLIALPFPILLAFFYNVNLFLALALSVIFIVLANGVKAIVLSVMTFKMRNFLNAGAYSAISNGVASVAAGVAPTIIGAIIDKYGWQASYFTTFGIAAFVVLALIIIDIIVIKDDKIRHQKQIKE